MKFTSLLVNRNLFPKCQLSEKALEQLKASLLKQKTVAFVDPDGHRQEAKILEAKITNKGIEATLECNPRTLAEAFTNQPISMGCKVPYEPCSCKTPCPQCSCDHSKAAYGSQDGEGE